MINRSFAVIRHKIKEPLGWGAAALLLLFQSAAVNYVLPLSLGPLVIVQPWLMDQGFLMYDNIGDNHTPLMPLVLSFLRWLVPDGPKLARISLVFLILLSGLLLYRAARRRSGIGLGLAAVFFFVAWAPAFGFGKLWHETFLTPLFLALILLWPEKMAVAERRRAFLTGLVIGLAILVKQQAGLVWLGWAVWWSVSSRFNRRPWRSLIIELVWMAAGSALPFGLFLVYQFGSGGALSNLWFWVVTFNAIGFKDLIAQAPTFSQIKEILPAYLLVIPFVVAAVREFGKSTRWQEDGWVLILFLCGTLTAYPRFGFFHLQPSLPVLAYLSVQALTRIFAWSKGTPGLAKYQLALTISFLLFWGIYSGSAYVQAFEAPGPRQVYEYSDLVPLAGDIREQIGPDACVYLVPDDEAVSNLYYLLDCLPPRDWVFTGYPWHSIDRIASRVLATVQQASPEWVAYFPGRWLVEQHNPKLIAYIQDHYELVSTLSWDQGEVRLMRRIP